MVLLLEAAFQRTRPGFAFPRGRSRHRVFLLNDEPIATTHHPLVFYVVIWLCTGLGNTALWLVGFRFYGPASTVSNAVSTTSSRELIIFGAAVAVPDSHHALITASAGSLAGPHRDGQDGRCHGGRQRGLLVLARLQVSPRARSIIFIAQQLTRSPLHLLPIPTFVCSRSPVRLRTLRRAAQEASLTPVVYAHGISGIYGPTPFILLLCWLTGRPMFIPELPYVAMRLSPPSAIRTRVQFVAAARRMLWRHGFGITFDDSAESDEEDEDWRRGRAVFVGHSLGAGPIGWILRDAPDLVAGTVLIDPMSILLFAADSPRNFFRTR